MAVNNETNMSSTARRLFFGTNVAVVVLLALVVLVGVNLIGRSPKLSVRKDLAGGLASHRLSERTKGILDQYNGDLTVTTVYTSDEPGSNHKEYLPRLQDYLDELGQHKRAVKVQHLHSGDERAALRDRIEGKFGEATEKYKDVVTANEQLWTSLEDLLKSLQAGTRDQLASGGWLSGFTTLANLDAVLRKDLEDMGDVRREITDLVRGEGIPRYQEANSKIKAANDNYKQHLEELQTWMKETEKLVKVLSQTDSEFAAKSRENLAVMQGLLLNMRKAVGDPADREVSGDPVTMIKEYAKAANAMSRWLFDEFNRVSAFVKENPGLEQHPKWSVRVQVAFFESNMPLHELLQQSAEQLGGNVEQLRRIVSEAGKLDELTLKNIVVQLRQGAAQVEQMLGVWSKNLTSVLADAGKIDEKSRQFLSSGVSGDLFKTAVPATQPNAAPESKSIIAQLTDLNSRIDELPKLELDEIADRMKEDNIVVIETDKSVRIVPFDEVWPAAADRDMMREEDASKLHRVFDGDRAIGSAVNTLMANKKVATVILTGFESNPPPQMRQFQRPNTGPIPFAQLSVLKDRLEKANFAVKEWNLGDQGEQGQQAKKGPPAPEEGTQAIYIFLPPGEAPPMNPMMQQAPPPSFGPEQLEQVKKVLGDGGKGVFLAFADAYPRMDPRQPPANYAYADMLSTDWGVDVKFDHRVVRGVRDPQRPDHFNIDIVQWSFMPLNNFTEHPIGNPLKARRLLMAEVCPVMKAATVPEGVKVSPVLEVPATSQDMWADPDISRIFNALRQGQRDSSFTKGDNVIEAGFPVIVASENEKTKGKVVVMGMGFSFIDPFLSRPVPRLEAKKTVTLSTDPAPTENVDLALNTLYWLADQPKMIAAGPAPIPLVGPVDPGSQRSVYLVSLGWALAALVMGAVVMFARRK